MTDRNRNRRSDRDWTPLLLLAISVFAGLLAALLLFHFNAK